MRRRTRESTRTERDVDPCAAYSHGRLPRARGKPSAAVPRPSGAISIRSPLRHERDGRHAIGRFQVGEKPRFVDTFLRGTCGAEYRSVLERAVPNAVEQAVADAATFFEHELPALRQWSFGPDEAHHVRQPVLAVLGEQSDSRFHQRQKLLLEWLPNAEAFVLPLAGHLLHLQNPGGMAAGLAAFFARHPIA